MSSAALTKLQIFETRAIVRAFSSPKLVQPNASGARRVTRMALGSTPSKQELLALPGVVKARDPSTKDFIFQQTMYRIKDPKRSLEFYTGVLGFTLLEKLDFPEMKFSLYFLGQYSADEIPEERHDRVQWVFSRPGCLELTHNWGTENEEKDPFVHNGNSEPQGYGHIGFEVPDVVAACKRFEDLGVKFVKKPDGGKMKDIAFIQDPDSYWIEIFNRYKTRNLID